MNRWIVLLLLFFFGFVVQGQDTIKLKCIALPMGDSIIVKWIPGNVYSWQLGNDKGYQLTRSTVRINGITLPFQQQEESQKRVGLFKMLEKEDWLAIMDTTNQWDVLASGTVYGDELELKRNGDLDLQYFIDKEIETQNKFAFNFFATNQSLAPAVNMGQAYIDKEVEKGTGYLYEVNIYGDTTMASYLVFDNQVTTFTQPQELSAEGKDSAIWIYWNHQYTEDQYFSYDIERSTDQVNYYQVNDAPVIQGGDHYVLSFLDAIPKNGTTYYYRIRGKSPFGLYGPYSEVVSAEGKDIPDYLPPTINVIEEYPPGEMNVSWNFPNDLEMYIRGFNVYRSVSYDGPYEELAKSLLSPEERNFLDSNPLRNNYYKIEVIYLTGESKSSASYLINLRDITPPSIPQGITCSLDTMKKVIHLEWEANDEPDLLGYRLFMSGSERGDYFDVRDSMVLDNVYDHSIEPYQDGEALYFRVASVDNRYNRSKRSDFCRVELLDRRRPSPPLIRKVMMQDTSIVLEWASSPDEEVAFHIIERRPQHTLEWTEITKEERPGGEIYRFEDKEIQPGIQYQYRIMVVDHANNTSVSKIRSGRLNDNKRKPAIETLQLLYDETKDQWYLQWEYSPPELLYRFVIYRSEDGNNFRTYKNINDKNLEKMVVRSDNDKTIYNLVDKNATEDNMFFYRIKAVWKDGQSSELSKTVNTSARE